jgi:glycosyltransferase involved in cell wall biosynthesis
MIYQKNELGYHLLHHNNDYGFNPLDCLANTELPERLPSLSIVIPYYETGTIFTKTLHHLYNAISQVINRDTEWDYEVLVCDDGSKKHPAKILVDHFPKARVISSVKNNGRTWARNIGLQYASKQLCLFLDSDVLIDSMQLISHLLLHTINERINRNAAITVSFFYFTTQADTRLSLNQLTPSDIPLNDYRLNALYGETWIGCEEDRKYIGKQFHIVHDTKYFRSWKGMYYAWALSNMILGGLFMVDTTKAKLVNGFDSSFTGYSFTETTLPTKLIALQGAYVIPSLVGGGMHIEDKEINVPYQEKIRLFRKRHDYYFNSYLKLSIDQALGKN